VEQDQEPVASCLENAAVHRGTSALLEDLLPGSWYYRVRGLDPYIAGTIKQMTWSTPQRLNLPKPQFTIQPGSVIQRPVKR
jgi:hypothetical protein